MTDEELIKLARELQFAYYYDTGETVGLDKLRAFADRVAASERERICKAIKEEDDYCVTEGNYMLDSNDCITVAKSEWVRPDYSEGTIRARGDR